MQVFASAPPSRRDSSISEVLHTSLVMRSPEVAELANCESRASLLAGIMHAVDPEEHCTEAFQRTLHVIPPTEA